MRVRISRAGWVLVATALLAAGACSSGGGDKPAAPAAASQADQYAKAACDTFAPLSYNPNVPNAAQVAATAAQQAATAARLDSKYQPLAAAMQATKADVDALGGGDAMTSAAFVTDRCTLLGGLGGAVGNAQRASCLAQHLSDPQACD